MMIHGELRHKNKTGLTTSRCSKIYSSVAMLNTMLLLSARRMSNYPGPDVINGRILDMKFLLPKKAFDNIKYF